MAWTRAEPAGRRRASAENPETTAMHGGRTERSGFDRSDCDPDRGARPVTPVDAVGRGSYFRRMRSIGIKALNNRLSEYVRLAASGETILVTDRDRVVAELGPLRESRSPVLADAFLAEAVRSGVLAPPALIGSGAPPRPAPVACLDEVLAELDDNRRDR